MSEKQGAEKQRGGVAPFAVRFAERATQKKFGSAGMYGDSTTADMTGSYEDPHSDDN